MSTPAPSNTNHGVIKSAIQSASAGQDLDDDSMRGVMQALMQGHATPAQIGAFLVAMRMKGETVEELTVAAKVMREWAVPVPIAHANLVDTCGTGGDGACTFNISTTCAFVAAAAGAVVVKHGNRSMSSRSGSADVLEAAGMRLDLSSGQVAECIRELGIGFAFAPAHHPATARTVQARREIGGRSLFNLLGPLCNPASAPRQVIGVFDKRWLNPLAKTLRNLGSSHVLVVHAEDGLDEISIAATTHVAELRDGDIRLYTLHPGQFGLPTSQLDTLVVNDPAQSLQIMERVLNDEPGPARDIVVLNAAAALLAADVVPDMAQGIELSRAALRSGAAHAKFRALRRHSQSFHPTLPHPSHP